MVRQIAHLCILAQSLEETERFYCSVLGLRKGFEFRKGGELVGFYLDAGGRTFIEVFRGNPGGTESRIRHFCIEVDDLDTVKRRLAEHGIATSEIQRGCDNSYQIWCKDPNGIDIEFHQYTEASLQLVGGVAEVSW